MNTELDELYEDGLMINRMLRDIKKMVYKHSQSPLKIYEEMEMTNKIAKMLLRRVDKYRFKNIKLTPVEDVYLNEIIMTINTVKRIYEEASNYINKSDDVFYKEMNSLLMIDPYLMEYRFDIIS